jgi:eukaryotic translation initiation factor 2C
MPHIPLVDVGGQKTNYLPPEVCEILPNQPYRGKLTDEHTAEMIKVAAKPPNVNATAIAGQGLNGLGFKQGAAPLSAFGISVGQEMAIVPGRILPPPGIRYGQGTPNVDDKAGWNLRGVRFAVSGELKDWGVLLIQDGGRDEFSGITDPQLRSTIKGFADMCRTSGMRVDQREPLYAAASLPAKNANDPTRKAAVATIREKVMKGYPRKPTVILVILSSGDKHVYNGIKHLCDVYLKVATVCVHAAKIRKERGQVQYFANVALKMNMKMGGVNHRLEDAPGSPPTVKWLSDPRQPTMLVGMDVTHPSPGSVRGTPSVAAVVATIDDTFAQLPASLKIQQTKKEVLNCPLFELVNVV